MLFSFGHLKDKMEFKSTFFAITIIGMVALALGSIINDWGVEYHSGVTSETMGMGNYEKLGEISGYASQYSQNGSINPQSGEASSDTESITYRGAFGIITGIFKPLRIVYSMLDSAFELFSLPDYIKYGIITMMIAAAVFTIVAIIFRQLRESV